MVLQVIHLDIFDFMKVRNVDLDECFQLHTKINSDLEKGFKQLQHDIEKQIKLWWDKASLEMYITKNLTPRRLRRDVSPLDGVEDLNLLDEWYQFFNSCEKSLCSL